MQLICKCGLYVGVYSIFFLALLWTSGLSLWASNLFFLLANFLVFKKLVPTIDCIAVDDNITVSCPAALNLSMFHSQPTMDICLVKVIGGQEPILVM